MKTILVCTDGSAYSPSLYDHALWAARRLGAHLHIVHLIEPAPLAPLGADYGGVLGTEAHLQLSADILALEKTRVQVAERRSRAILASALAHLQVGGLPVERIRVEVLHGSLSESVAKLSTTHDLVLVGKRGEHHADDAHLGDNLERVLRTSAHPVLVASRAYQPIERFLLAYDGGPAADKAVAHLIETPLLRGLPCHLVSVGTPEDIRESAVIAARDRLAAAGYAVRSEIVSGVPNEVIADTVRREHASLIVMGAYGHGRVRRFFLGSTTSDMIRGCIVPLLMFR